MHQKNQIKCDALYVSLIMCYAFLLLLSIFYVFCAFPSHVFFILFNDHNKTCQFSIQNCASHFILLIISLTLYVCIWAPFIEIGFFFASLLSFIKFSTSCFWHRSLNMVTALLNFFPATHKKQHWWFMVFFISSLLSLCFARDISN